jgi:hypothetical protein
MKHIGQIAETLSAWGGGALAVAMAGMLPVGAATSVSRLQCEHLTDPLGIDSPRPNLSWVITSNRRGQRQTAYQVLVASDPDKLQAGQADRTATVSLPMGEAEFLAVFFCA